MSFLKNYVFILIITLTIPMHSKISITNIHHKVSSFFSTAHEEIHHQEFQNINQIELFCQQGNISIHTWKQNSCIMEIKKQGSLQQIQSTPIDLIQEEGLLQIQINNQCQKTKAVTHISLIIPEQASIKVATKHGKIFIKNAFESIYAYTDFGNIDIIDGQTDIIAKTHSGNITIQREQLKQQHSITAETQSGNITLQVPQHINSSIQAHTKHGKIYSNLLITLEQLTTKLNDEIYKKFKQNLKGFILQDTSAEVAGKITLTTNIGTIKIHPYI